MTETTWIQFSIAQNFDAEHFPSNPFTFLGRFFYANKHRIVRWHFLFEPHILLRVQTEHEQALVASLYDVANSCGMQVRKGDVGQTSPSNASGYVFYGEQQFYGTDEMWQANADLLDATSRIAIMAQAAGTEYETLSKVCHLVVNQFGNHYGQEAMFYEQRVKRSKELYEKYGEK